MKRRRHSREDAVGRWRFVDLYEGALRIKNKEKRLIAATLVLLTGRLKMRISEAIHFHEGWYLRDYGLIRVPAFEPCLCKWCWKRAGRNHTEQDPYDSEYERFTQERYREKNRNTRYVPVSWSPRIQSCIEKYLDEIEVYPKSHRTVSRLLDDHILPNTETLEPGDINWRGMRATGDTFWAFSGLDTKTRAAIGGHRETELGTYSGSSPLELANHVRKAQGMEPLDFPDYDPVASTVTPDPMEPFPDPREVNPLEKFNPYEVPPIFNPRSEKCGVDFELDREDFDTIATEGKEPSIEQIQTIVARFEARLEGDAEETADPYGEAYETLTDENERGPGQSSLGEWNRTVSQPVAVPVYSTISVGKAITRRLNKEWDAITKKETQWASSQKMAKGTAASLALLSAIGIMMAIDGIYVDPFALQVSSPQKSTAGVLSGAMVGAGTTLLADYQTRVKEAYFSEWIDGKFASFGDWLSTKFCP